MRRARVAVVGAGWWSHVAHLPALAGDERAELVAVCDPDPARARDAAERFGAARVVADLAELVAGTELDAVVIATPHTTHAALARTALRAGLHVLVEKPMTTRATDAWELEALARTRGLRLMVGVTYLYASTFEQVVRLVREEIGELVAVNGEFSSNAQVLFAQSTEPDPTAVASVPHGASYADPALSGGGQGQTQLTHLLGALLTTTGLQAEQVSAFMDSRGLAVDVVDALTFRLSGGALATATSTGTTPEGVPPRHLLRYHGAAGMVEHDLLRARALVHRRGGRTTQVEPAPSEPTYPLQGPARALVRLVLDGGRNPAPGSAGAATAALVEAAYHASRTGGREPVQQGPVELATVPATRNEDHRAH